MRTRPGALILGALLLAACSSSPETRPQDPPFPPYLGESLPGDTAVLFAPGVVSIEGRYEYGVSFSPDGSELLVTGNDPDGPAFLVHHRAGEGGWSAPERVQLSGGLKGSEMEAFFTPEGDRVYFAPFDQGMDVRIWVVDRGPEGWHSPRPVGSPVADVPAFFPTSAAGGILYYSNLAERRPFRARIEGDSVLWSEDTGIQGMHAYPAPDESFVLVDARMGEGEGADIYVAFKEPDGGWSELVDLGPGVNTDYSETCPSLSPDGRFIFFSRYNEPGELSNIYWVSAEVIRRAREDAYP